jgi:hypothetical protein
MGFLRTTLVSMPSVTASVGAFALSGQTANLTPGSAPSGGFNNKKVQTNLSDMQTASDYAFLNVLKSAQTWACYANANAPLTPDMLDSNGYLITMAGNASSGIYTAFFLPSQQRKPGAWIYKWDGNGTVGSSNTNCTAVFYTISSITQSGGIQTINLSSSPAEMVAGQPIALSNIGGGTWNGLSNTWTVLDVNVAGNSFRINTGTTYTGTQDPLTSARATFTKSTTVANGTGLNGSGRYAVNLSSLIGGGNTYGAGCDITNIQSSVDYPHNIRVVHITDEAALDAGGIFTSLFLSTVGYFGVVRFLDWQYTTSNQCNVTTWATRKPVGYVSYEADEKRSNLYAGGTTLSGRTYSTSAPAINSATGAAWSGLTDKSTVHILFAQGAWAPFTITNTVSGNNIAIPGHTYVNGDRVAFFDGGGAGLPANVAVNTAYFVRNAVAGTSIQISATAAGAIITPSANFTGTVLSSGQIFLNVGGTGAKMLLNTYANLIGNPGANYQWPEANTYRSLSTVVYDSTLDAYIMHGGTAVTGSAGLLNFCPYEIQLALCTAVGAHPHWVAPIFALDPMTDFMPSLMQLAKTTGPSWMIPRYEPPNELWNTYFPQTSIAGYKATAYGWAPGDFYNWYGKALSTLGQAAAIVYGGVSNLGTTYAILGGVQGANGSSVGNMNNNLSKFSSASYIGTTPQSPLTGAWGTITFSATAGVAEAWRWTSHLTYANYITPSIYYATDGPQTRDGLAAAYNGSKFTATIASGVMTVASLDAGANLTVGATIFGAGVPTGVTITSLGTGTGGAGTYNLSNSSFSMAYSQSYLSGVDLTAPLKQVDSLIDTVFNGTITGSSLVVNSIVSGNTVPKGLAIYGGTIAYGSGCYIIGGTYPNYTLNQSPGNQTANFSVGIEFSLTGSAFMNLNWATWANSNFSIKKITAYEGGYSVDMGVLGTAFDLMSERSKSAPNLQTYTKTNYDNFRGVGTVTFPSGVIGEFPSAFAMTGPYPIGSGWSVLDDIYQTAVSAQWAAIIAY